MVENASKAHRSSSATSAVVCLNLGTVRRAILALAILAFEVGHKHEYPNKSRRSMTRWGFTHLASLTASKTSKMTLIWKFLYTCTRITLDNTAWSWFYLHISPTFLHLPSWKPKLWAALPQWFWEKPKGRWWEVCISAMILGNILEVPCSAVKGFSESFYFWMKLAKAA